MAQPQALIPLWQRRSALLLSAALLFVVIVFGYAGGLWPIALYRLLTDGVLAVAWMAAVAGWGAFALRVTRLERVARPQDGLLLLVSGCGVGLGILSLAVLGLGLAGWMSGPVAWAVLGAGWTLGAVRLLGARPWLRSRALQAWLGERAGCDWLWLLPVVLLALAVVAAMVTPGLLWGADDPAGYDAVEYHLQVPREWYDLHRIAPLRHNVFSYFPFAVEMHYLLAMYLRGGPWAGMYLAQIMHVGFVLLTIVGVYAAARGTRGGRPSATVAAVAAASAPWMPMLAAVAYCEGGLLLYGVLSIAWALRWLSPSPGAGEGSATAEERAAGAGNGLPYGAGALVLSGLMGGLACGAKLTGVPMLLVAIPAGLWVSQGLARSGRGRRARSYGALAAGTALFVVAGVVVFAPWLMRNWKWAGNPVFPEQMGLLGRGHFDSVQVERWRLAHHLPEPARRAPSQRVLAIWQQILGDPRYSYILFPLAAFAAALNWRQAQARFLVVLLLVLALFWLGFTHLQSRFFVLAIPVAALLIAEVNWGRWLPIGAAVVVLAGAVGAGDVFLRLSRCAAWIGPDDMQPLMPELLSATELQRLRDGAELLLVGDAKAFWYDLPSQRLHYRTVFDVDGSSRSPVQAWAGGAQAVVPRGWVIRVDPAEVGRFAGTYFKAPEAPESWPRERFELRP